ncbi:helix-turn-helix transcriptional regulator [Actinoplanes sp. NEAU-A12]|uniref:Helix-turn-helix transcriptional regulator n=1 Tax=Actinoplanes sandaracinus TaxID=3045177 RepID=A0ABT6WSR9_9ACTN|nr:helix-turn-helix transcriptional regulator [Actinoplanes sandaracinus]MDI6102783.1 helix-turn-helix transcriptional regulator [Actinoplanes sandaracinus]
MAHTPGPPDDEEEAVGATLARMRHASGLTGAELAERVGMSQPKISRIERGLGRPDPKDIGIIARALGAGAELALQLSERAEQMQDRMTDWRPPVTGFAGQQRSLTHWESTATILRVFEPALVPGLLQTSGYAKSVFREFRGLIDPTTDDLTEQELLAAVSARVKRQVALADRSKSFRFVVGESVLRPRKYPLVEMLTQISHLRDVLARHANVSIALLRDDAPVIPPLHGFELLDDRLVVVDLYNTGLISRSRKDVDTYRRLFDTYAAHAVDIAPVLDEYQNVYIDMLRTSPAS